MLDRLKTLLGGPSPRNLSSGGRSPLREPVGAPFTRPSNGLDQFFTALRDQSGLKIIDFAGTSQANVSFITNMGHGVSSEEFMRLFEGTFGSDERLLESQNDPRRVDEFLQELLTYPPNQFDGALAWDSLQFLTPHLLQITVDRVYEVLRPGAYLFAIFHANEKAREIPTYHYRIQDQKTLLLTPRGQRVQAQFFNNRALEKLFHRYQSVKFFLTRDNLREIIVRR